jgi:hypothetical protein
MMQQLLSKEVPSFSPSINKKSERIVNERKKSNEDNSSYGDSQRVHHTMQSQDFKRSMDTPQKLGIPVLQSRNP